MIFINPIKDIHQQHCFPKISFKASKPEARKIDMPEMPDAKLSRLNFEIQKLLNDPKPLSIHHKDNCQLLTAITGRLPENNKGFEINNRQLQELGLYFESIPAVTDNMKNYIVRLNDNLILVSILDNANAQVIKPEFLIPKKTYGIEARRLDKKYYGAGLSESELASQAVNYRASHRKNQTAELKHINPQRLQFKLPQITDRPSKMAFLNLVPDNNYMFHSVGTNYVESYLHKTLGEGAVDTLNLDVQLDSKEVIKQKLKSFDPDIIGISSKVNTKEDLDEWMSILRKDFPDKLFVIGGTIPTYAYNEVLAEHPETLLILDNGEIPTTELMRIVMGNKDINHLKDIPNLAFNYDGEPLLTPYQFFNMARHYVPSDSNVEEIVKKGGTLALRWSQGCWGNCTFCTHPGKWDGSSVENIISVLKDWKNRFNIKALFFTDDEVVPKDPQIAYQRLEQFADRMIEENLNITWTVSLRADCINWLDEKLINKLKKSGCNSFFLGIESGSNSQLKRFAKSAPGVKVDVDVNEKALKFFKDNNITVGVGWIPFDPAMPTLKELRENMDFFKRNDLFDLNVRMNSALRVQKGSAYARILADKKMNLLQELQYNLLFYDSVYLDPRVGTIKEHVDVWYKGFADLDQKINAIKFNVAVDPSLKAKHKDVIELGEQLQKLAFDYIQALLEKFPETDEDRRVDNDSMLLKDKEFLTQRRKQLLQEVTTKRPELFELTRQFKLKQDKIISTFNVGIEAA